MKISLGSAQFGFQYGISNKTGKVAENSVHEIIDAARAAGITAIDTAMDYGDSESVLGRAGVSDFELVSKISTIPESSGKLTTKIFQQIEQSLNRLGVPSLHGLLLHNSNSIQTEFGDHICNALAKAQEEGLVKKLGVSIYSPQEFEIVRDRLPIGIVQAPFNVFDNRIFESKLAQKLSAQNIELHTRSTFLQGLLLLPTDRIPDYFKPWLKHIHDWHNWLSVNNLKPLDFCINYALSKPMIGKVVVGVDSVRHLKEIVSSVNESLNGLATGEGFVLRDELILNPSNWKIE